jgi:hypothetical protein
MSKPHQQQIVSYAPPPLNVVYHLYNESLETANTTEDIHELDHPCPTTSSDF